MTPTVLQKIKVMVATAKSIDCSTVTVRTEDLAKFVVLADAVNLGIRNMDSDTAEAVGECKKAELAVHFAMDTLNAECMPDEPVKPAKPVEKIEWNKMTLQECHAFCYKHAKWERGCSECGTFEFWQRGWVDHSGQACVTVSLDDPLPLTMEEAQKLPAGWTIEKKTTDVRTAYSHYTLAATRRVNELLSRSVCAEADSELLCAWRLKVACLVDGNMK